MDLRKHMEEKMKTMIAKLLVLGIIILAVATCSGGGGGNNNLGQNDGISLPKTGQVTSYGTGSNDDGALQKGAVWPSPRFTAMSSGTGTVVKDNLTDIEWAGDGGTPTVVSTSTCTGGTLNWQGALDYVSCLNTNNYLGHNDWRLPNRKELRSLANYGEADITDWLNTQGFSNVQTMVGYWSSSTWVSNPADYAWSVYMYSGGVGTEYKHSQDNYVWPVRAGVAPAPAEVPKSGQVTSYSANDDGALQSGAVWPSPRFTVSSSGAGTIVADKLTHLEWAGDGGTPTVVSTLTCTGGTFTWQEALDYISCLNTNNYLGQSDWRLPNITELESLVNVEKADLSVWLNTQGFSNVQADYYWSSSTWAATTTYAWYVSMASGDAMVYDKATNFPVWPVRTGQ
jgi:hypothetical protein